MKPKTGSTIYHVVNGNMITIPVEVVIERKKKVISSTGGVFQYDNCGNILVEEEGVYNIVDNDDIEW